MKIIKEGKVPERTRNTVRYTCGRCDAELEANSDDLYWVHCDPHFDRSGFYRCICPCCGERRDFRSRRSLPEKLARELPWCRIRTFEDDD